MAYFQLATVATALVQTELCMHLYLNQVGSGPNPNQFSVVDKAGSYGQTVVNDWSLTTAPGANSTIVGHARGLHMLASPANNQWYFSSNILFEDASFGGSMLSVTGFVPLDGEWSIVGGTGSFSGARGTIKHHLIPFSTEQNVYELDIHAFYDKPVSQCNM